jgi:hypothetical protein
VSPADRGYAVRRDTAVSVRPSFRRCRACLWLSLTLALPPTGHAQTARTDPAVYLIDSVAVAVDCDKTKWCKEPAHEFRLPKQFGMKPPLALWLTAYPAPDHAVSVVLLLVDSTGLSSVTLWKGQMKTDSMLIDPGWDEKRGQISSGRFVVKVIVDPPGKPTATTYQFILTKATEVNQ